jgi:hypothetical protein
MQFRQSRVPVVAVVNVPPVPMRIAPMTLKTRFERHCDNEESNRLSQSETQNMEVAWENTAALSNGYSLGYSNTDVYAYATKNGTTSTRLS